MKVIKLLCTLALISIVHLTNSLAPNVTAHEITRAIQAIENSIQVANRLLAQQTPLEERKQYFNHMIGLLERSPLFTQAGCPGFDQQIKKQTLQKMDETAFAISTVALENIPNILAQVENCLKETAAAPTHKPGPARGGAFEQAGLEELHIAQQGAVDMALKKLNDVCTAATKLKAKQMDAGDAATQAIESAKEIVNILAAQNLIDPNQPGLESVYKEIEKMRANKQWGASLKAEALRNDLRVLRFELINKIFKKNKESDLNINIPGSCMPEDGW